MKTMTKQSFASDNEVRWCPGCGDYAILAAMQRFLPLTGLDPENIVFVSGIGCAGRFPYYLNTYGFHAIHGRAPALATGIKMMNPELSVWLITGDGDGLSIGTNHLLHCLRRNLNINILLLNNQVYGLTKGQCSPTSPLEQVTKTSPKGVNIQPLNPLQLALAAGATFVARGLDKDPKHLATLFDAANKHQGTSFIEIYQNCPIFNDGAFSSYDDKSTRDDRVIYLDNDNVVSPLVFGKSDQSKGLVRSDEKWHIKEDVTLAASHDRTKIEQSIVLARLPQPDLPLPLGIYYQTERAIFSDHKKSVDADFDLLEALL